MMFDFMINMFESFHAFHPSSRRKSERHPDRFLPDVIVAACVGAITAYDIPFMVFIEIETGPQSIVPRRFRRDRPGCIFP
jgi:hypothetical protein